MDGTYFWALATVAAFCVGLSKGGAPAFGSLAVPILSLVISPVAAAGLLLPVFVFSDVFGVYAYRKHISWAVIKIAVIGIVTGTLVGWMTAHHVSDDLIRVLIGAIGLVFAVNFIVRSRGAALSKPRRVPEGIFWTSIAGFTSFVSHSGAPPWQVWVIPQNLPKMTFAGTSTMAFAIMNALKIGPYIALGQLQLSNLKVTLILFVPAVLAVFVGYVLVRALPTKVFYTIVTWALLLVSLKLVWDGATGL